MMEIIIVLATGMEVTAAIGQTISNIAPPVNALIATSNQPAIVVVVLMR